MWDILRLCALRLVPPGEEGHIGRPLRPCPCDRVVDQLVVQLPSLRTFAHLRIDMGEVHALFNGCLFYECDLRGFANCVISNPVFEWNPHAYLAHRLVFYCAAGVGKHVFGEIATLPDPDYIYKQSYEDVTAAVMAGTVWGRVRDGVVRVRSGMVRAKQRVASLRVSVATTTTASAV